DGDPRGAEVLAMLRRYRAGDPRMAHVEAVVEAAARTSGRLPNIDGMLAAICYVHQLPPAPALVMFAAGRLAGWLAHAQEQQAAVGAGASRGRARRGGARARPGGAGGRGARPPARALQRRAAGNAGGRWARRRGGRCGDWLTGRSRDGAGRPVTLAGAADRGRGSYRAGPRRAPPHPPPPPPGGRAAAPLSPPPP